jgi:hypothetical protein
VAACQFRPMCCFSRPVRRGPSRTAHSMRDNAHTLSDFRVPTLSIECDPCRYNVARLMEQYGDANCPKARSQSIHDR